LNIEGVQIGALPRNTSEALIVKRDRITRNKIIEKTEKYISRGIDIIGALCGITLLIPITVGIWIANKITKNKGPIFYNTERIGKDGKSFKMYKFRSMVLGADEKLKEYLAENPEAKKEYKKYKKLKYDPRVTKVGEFIRKTSLDEFPQFINVLKGEMSLVGPRPYLPREKEDMDTYYSSIVKCKPGVTGFWQISGRSNTTFDDRLQMDTEYSYTKNLKTDIKILLKTVKNVVTREGAI
jgi:undecaprenyl-phosphate galactose phosphotransferase